MVYLVDLKETGKLTEKYHDLEGLHDNRHIFGAHF